MAKKQVLQIKDFSGGVNSHSDPRDLQENEFQILDNASVDEQGIIRVSGGLEVKDNIDLSTYEHSGYDGVPAITDRLLKGGKGLFSYATDYIESSENSYLTSNGKDKSQAIGIVSDNGGTGGTWEFDALSTNTNNKGANNFGIRNQKIAINYVTYTALGSENHGSVSNKGLTLSPGETYNICFEIANENPWYFLGSNIPPRIRLYNDTLGKYLYPSGFSTVDDGTHAALISTGEGNCTVNADFWNASSGATIARQVVDASNPVSSSAAHKSYNSFFGSTDVSGASDTGAAYLKVTSAASGGAFNTTGKYAYSDNITVVANTTYLIDCIYNTNGTTGTTQGVGIQILNKDDSDAVIHFSNGTGTAPASSEWAHINAPPPFSRNSTPTPLEFTTPNGCTSISILAGVDNDGSGSDYAGFSGFNLRKKMYELNYIREVSDKKSRVYSSFKHPNTWANQSGGSVLDSPYILSSSLNNKFKSKRKYDLRVRIPESFKEDNNWVLSLEAGTWGGINQAGVNNFIIGYFDIIQNKPSLYNENNNIRSSASVGKTPFNIITQSTDSSYSSLYMDIYNYNPLENTYNLVYADLPTNTNSSYNFIKGSKSIYFCDEKFNDSNLYSLYIDEDNVIKHKNIDFSGPNISHSSSSSTFIGIDQNHWFDVKEYYLGDGHAGFTSNQEENNPYLTMTSSNFSDMMNNTSFFDSNDWRASYETMVEEGGDSFNQFTGDKSVIEQDVASGTGSGLLSGLKGFKYDLVGATNAWKDATNPYTKYIVIRDQDIVGTTQDKLLTGTRIAKVQIGVQHKIVTPHLGHSSLYEQYIPKIKIYLDVVTTGATDMDSGGAGYAVPGDANFIANIGEVEVNPDNFMCQEGGYNYTPYGEYVNEWSVLTEPMETFPSGYQWMKYTYDPDAELGWGFGWDDNPIWRRPEYDYQGDITINIPYTVNAAGSAIAVGTTSTNLQLRFVPQIDVSLDAWHKGSEFDYYAGDSSNGYNGNANATLGILAEQWEIKNCKLYSYVNASADVEASFTHITGDNVQSQVSFETPFSGEPDGWDTQWRIHLTSVDNNDIESAFGQESGLFINTDVTKSPRIDIVTKIDNTIFNSSKFIKGYMTSKRNSNYNLQFIIDCNKKTIRSSTSKEEHLSTDFDTIRIYNLPSTDTLLPNEIDSYESESGVLSKDAESNSKMFAIFKTGVVANNTLYVGNVLQNGTSYPDRMLKSPIGKAPLLPSSNFIDVAINDGDEIISLQFYKDRLLQFKKDKLFIINTSEDYEYLQDTVENVGIFQDSQVTKTPYGIAWVNERGCYLYDGNKVNNLIDGKIGYKKWKDSESTWEIEGKYGASIMYLKKDDKIIVYGATKSISDISLEEGGYGAELGIGQVEAIMGKQYLKQLGYQYDFKTKSWTNLTNFQEQLNFDWVGIDDGNPRLPNRNDSISNFTYDENGDSIFIAKPSNLIMKWNDSPRKTTGDLDLDEFYGFPSDMTPNTVHRDFRIITKDYDFGAPSVSKKVYKVYVTFKSTHIESNKIKKVRQNQDEYSSSNVGVYYAVNGTNNWTEFSETKSKNYGTKGLISDNSETTTTLSSGVSPSATTINVASASNIKVGYVLIVGDSGAAGNERMLVLSISGTTITVDRNYSSYDSDPYTAWVEGAPFLHQSGDTVSISTGDWIVAELKASSSINKIDSFKLKFETKKIAGASNANNSVPSGFMINDISVIYRTKNVK